MTTTHKTPTDHVIHPRDIAFGRTEQRPRWWMNNDPIATHFWNALSVTFPMGERFFMDSVRHYRNSVPAELAPQVQAFLVQEAMHTREHVVFNRQVTDTGYDITRMEAKLKSRIEFARGRPAWVQLGITIALEHFTAILAHALLAEPVHLEGATPEAKRMWRWHAMEEIEHKAVAYDTYMAGLRKAGPVRRWTLRSLTMFVTTFFFLDRIITNLSDFYSQDGINTPKTWWKTFQYAFFKPGIFGHVVKSYFSYYRPGFHPWEEDDRDLLADAQAEYDQGFAAA